MTKKSVFILLACLFSMGLAFSQSLTFATSLSDSKQFDGFGPVIRLNAARRPINLVVDTGSAPTMVISSTLNSKNGKNSSLCSSTIPIQIGQSFSTQLPCATVPAIPEFSEADISGMLSPQDLAIDAIVIIDFPKKTFSRVALLNHSSEEVFRSMFTDRAYARLSRIGGAVGAILVKGKLGERSEGIFDIDTGNPYSKFSRKYVGSSSVAGSQGTISATGTALNIQQLTEAEAVSINDFTSQPFKAWVTDETPNVAGITIDGNIGRDVLRKCAIGIAPRSERLLLLACIKTNQH